MAKLSVSFKSANSLEIYQTEQLLILDNVHYSYECVYPPNLLRFRFEKVLVMHLVVHMKHLHPLSA